jgi:ABC-2 type transport system permease protein
VTGAYALRDSTTMLRRNLRHLRRYPGLSLFPIFMPVVFLLLFVYVFGGTLGDGITAGGGRGAYVNFLTPGMLLFTVAGAAQITAISVAKDMTEGIIARFKTMRIWRPAVLAGHVLGSLFLTLISLAIVIAVALLIGYHSTAGPLRWMAALGLLTLLAIALIWLSVAFGLVALLTMIPGGPLGNPDTGKIIGDSPFMDSIVVITALHPSIGLVGVPFGP